MKQSVIIIGAGIGGLATAAKLLKRGYDVRMIEKNSCCGGKTGTIREEGFTFDMTASIMLMPYHYKKISDELGLPLDFIKLDKNYKGFYSDGTELVFDTDLTNSLELIEKMNHEDGIGYLKFLFEGYKKYQIAYDKFLGKNFDCRDDMLNGDTLKGIIQSYPMINSYRYISKFIEEEKIRNFLAFQTMYIGTNPFTSSCLYTLIPVITALKGLWYLKGGLYSFVSSLQEYILDHNGKIDFNTTCKEITIEDGFATGVRTDKGFLNGDIIVCNSDYTYSVNTFFNHQLGEKKAITDKNKKFSYSCSVFMIYLGLKKKYDTFNVHNIYIGPNFKKNLEAAFKGRLPLQPSFYIYCPSKIDPSMAPEGKDAINVMVRVPNTFDGSIVWDEKQIKSMRDILVQSLQKIKGLEDINENIQYERYLTPTELEESFNCSYGSAFGIKHNLAQTAFFRPQIKSMDFKNLYFIGDSVHPGTGVSLVLLGSELLCQYL